ncbi:hypothetical protein FIBSPDRAFT_857834 [Athelia psychrophila]|uniref:RING-type domain-containing protein n=1 Tax=Athelia psychrophila TaxID=1759441 RepID=A0A166MIW2_9AGAM|nr:hypothetical protein FIBSPDRAFT_857834 [Fibularhizoctonia sp. CBS 109695]
MPSPPQSPTYLANLTVRKPTHENNRPHKRAKREESPVPASPSQLTRTLIPKADTAADIDEDEDEVKDIADDKINKEEDANEDGDEQDEDEEQCSICLQPLVDRTVIPTCAHEFCLDRGGGEAGSRCTRARDREAEMGV